MNKIIETHEKFPQTEIWMDSFHIDHHAYAIENHNTGVTTSPTWVSRMMCDEPVELHKPIIQELQKKYPTMNEYELIWQWTLKMGEERSKMFLPMWKEGQPTKGRFSIQTSIYDYNHAERMLQMARDVHACNVNMQVKIPSTSEGIKAMEEATYEGISVMATLCFSVDQAIAAATAIENGMKRRAAEGKSNASLNPVCAVLLGMQEDWLRAYADKENIVIQPDAFNYAGVAICKKIYHIFKERGYQTRILTAYYRHQLHWSEFIGGDIIMTIPYKWQKRFASCDVNIEDNMAKPVAPTTLAQLEKLEPFVQAYTEHTLQVEDFNSFPPVIMTLRYFTKAYEQAVHKVRDFMLVDPTK